MTRQLRTPFGDEPCEDVPLSEAPLARVLAQLRFEPLAALESSNTATLFGAEIGSKYPYIEKASQFNMLISPGQVSPQVGQNPVWRFRSPDKKTVVSLANGSISLETTAYPGRTSFCADLSDLAAALKKVAFVPAYDRIGYRYTNRVTGDEVLEGLPGLIRSEILGVSGSTFGGSAKLQHCLAQASFLVDENHGLLAQWGEMPPGGTFDPTLSAVQEHSWILDLDSYFQSAAVSSEPEDVKLYAERLSTSAYRFFRWVVTDEFLARYGGDVR
ncbi:TIGR04255 family protein [Streptomyces sp. NBC_00490]|uniref:TIGR04255 family protein n=1 Tax=Streptomyces sp. NBC_00490 TaxID=2903657 RepID=UPI002E187654